MKNYLEHAEKIAESMGLEINVKFLKCGKHFTDDKENRDIYEVTLKRKKREFSFNFGQSIHRSGKYHALSPYLKNKVGGTVVPDTFNLRHEWNLKKCDFKKNENFKIPDTYEVLSALQKEEVGTFNDFCDNFGYDNDSDKALNIYKDVEREYSEICKLFSEDELEELREIW